LAAPCRDGLARRTRPSGGYSGERVESYLAAIPNLILLKPFDLGGLQALIERRLVPTSEGASEDETTASVG
jgi:hypothetical protein